MFNWLSILLVIGGSSFLGGSIISIRYLITQVPHGALRVRWYAMGILISVFIAGYIGYGVMFWFESDDWHDLIVPLIFFCGGVFVWLTTLNAKQTIMDMRRVALLEHETITDPLIGIYNRRYLDNRLDEEFSKAKRYGTKLSVLMLDIDHFKRVNDTYGHHAGDLVLSHIGKLVLASIRTSDIVARYGGEELMVISPNASTYKATLLAERIRQYVATHPLTLVGEKNQEIHVTISIGVAELAQGMADSTALVCNADKALYRAKQNGRNRVES